MLDEFSVIEISNRVGDSLVYRNNFFMGSLSKNILIEVVFFVGYIMLLDIKLF